MSFYMVTQNLDQYSLINWLAKRFFDIDDYLTGKYDYTRLNVILNLLYGITVGTLLMYSLLYKASANSMTEMKATRKFTFISTFFGLVMLFAFIVMMIGLIKATFFEKNDDENFPVAFSADDK